MLHLFDPVQVFFDYVSCYKMLMLYSGNVVLFLNFTLNLFLHLSANVPSVFCGSCCRCLWVILLAVFSGK